MIVVQSQMASVATANANAPIHILVVEDDAALRAILREAFEAEGIAVLEAADKAALLRNLETEPIDLITLDLGLGQEDGLELARQIRAKRNIPIVMITGRGAPIDRVTGLEHGADDYISKPFHIREVLLRIHNILRRYQREEGMPKAREARRYAFDRAVLDSAKREVRKADGMVLDLTDREFDLLELFLKHPARVLSRDEILQSLQGREWSPFDRTIDGHVARLRRKIEPAGEAPTLIKSVRGVGYVFTGDVKPA
jgi:two-component system, OmpR family, response regulator